jgi:prolyl-tRNA synthetase
MIDRDTLNNLFMATKKTTVSFLKKTSSLLMRGVIFLARLFLRTAEFLWQEGHTAHTTPKEAVEEAELMLQVYADFAQNFMAMPVIKGLKTESERFAGAEETYCIEALMQDGKALQAGTSHYLGQNFAKAFDVKFATKEGTLEHVWGTSWGVSTRLMGGLIMTHSDDNGLVLPPNLAPIQVVIVPIHKTEEELDSISIEVDKIVSELKQLNISVKFDNRTNFKPGWKFNEYELKGVPVRIVVGPKDLESGTFEVARRDELSKETVSKDVIVKYVQDLLEKIQTNLLQKALDYRTEHTTSVDTFPEFKKALKNTGGFISAHWDGTAETEERIKEYTKATIRCIPLDTLDEEGKCVLTGEKSTRRVLFAKAY